MYAGQKSIAAVADSFSLPSACSSSMKALRGLSVVSRQPSQIPLAWVFNTACDCNWVYADSISKLGEVHLMVAGTTDDWLVCGCVSAHAGYCSHSASS